MPNRDSALLAAIPAAVWVAAALTVGRLFGLIAVVFAAPVLVVIARLRLLPTDARTAHLSVNEWTLALALASTLLLVPGTAVAIAFLRLHWVLFSSSRMLEVVRQIAQADSVAADRPPDGEESSHHENRTLVALVILIALLIAATLIIAVAVWAHRQGCLSRLPCIGTDEGVG